MLGNLVLAAGFGMMGLMGNPPRRRRKAKHRRNPMQQTIVFGNAQVRILHTRTAAGSAYYIVDRDTDGEYRTVTAIAMNRTSDLIPGPNRIPKGSPPWARAEKAWEAFKSGRSNPRRRRNPGSADGTAARELTVFITNDADLYRQNIQPVLKNLAKKLKKGTYDATKALKLWGYTAAWGAQKYTKEFGGMYGKSSGNGSYGAFSAATRREVAKDLQEYYQEELNDAAGIKANPRGGRDLTTEVFQIGQNTVVTTQWRNSSGTAFISVQTGGPVGVKVWEAKSQGPSAGGYHKPTQALERVYHKITGEYPRNFGGAGRRELEEVAKAAIEARQKQNPRRRNPHGRKIEIFVDGRYAITTTWAKTCKEAVASYKKKYVGANRTERGVPAVTGRVTASFARR